VNYINLFMQGLGHEVPYGYDERMGVDRYRLMHDFFDRYLKVEDELPPVILVVSPRENQEDVSPATHIIIDFAPVIDARSVIHEKGVRIICAKDNSETAGSWKVSHGGTRYTFLPAQVLMKNEAYHIEVNRKVKDKAGTNLLEEKTLHFIVAAE